MRPPNEQRTQSSLVNRLVLALFLASALLLPLPLGPSAPTPVLAATAGEIYVVDSTCCGGGAVIRVDPISGVQTIVSSGTNLVDPLGIAIAANGDLLVVDGNCCGSGGVLRVNPTTGVQTVVSSDINIDDPNGIAIAANGALLVVDTDCCGVGVGGVIRVNPNTGAQTVVATGTHIDDPLGVAIAANGDLIVADFSCCGGGGVIRVNPVTNAQTIVASGTNLVNPFGIAIAANGDLLVADISCCAGGGGVIRVNPVTNAQTIVASGTNLVAPVGIAIAPNGDLLVVDTDCCGGTGGVIRVDPATGVQTIVASGGNFINPRGIAIAPVLSIAGSSVAEGQSGTTNLTVTLGLAPYTSQTVSVQVATADGTAQAGIDYTSVGGTLTFSPGETSKTITVPIAADTAFEPDETILVNLANPSGANLAQTQATATIQNDDPQPALSVAATSLPEGTSGTSTATFNVSLSNPSSQTVSVQFATADGTAQAGSDYTATSNTLAFNPGETSQPVGVPVIGDTTSEPDETFTVNLSSPTNATIAAAQATGTIQNDDVAASVCGPRPTVGVAVTPAGAGRLQVTISPSSAPATPGNRLLQLRATIPANARIDVAGGPGDLAGAQVLPVGDGTQPVIFFVRRIAPGAVTVPLVAVDTCGEWPSFVGGGATGF